MTNASLSMPSRRVEVWFSGTAPQRRATVLFRIILAIPQFIVLFFLGIAGFFVAVIGWSPRCSRAGSPSSRIPI